MKIHIKNVKKNGNKEISTDSLFYMAYVSSQCGFFICEDVKPLHLV